TTYPINKGENISGSFLTPLRSKWVKLLIKSKE
ncbi:unnamed protein product, partial [marine sediment metagenome]